MKTITYLSPSSIAKFEASVDEFYLNYLSEHRPPRDPQTQPMSIGSAFDARCKSYLHEKLFGKNHKDSAKFDYQTIFESQVEELNRTWAHLHGRYAFEKYQSSGALLHLLTELQAAQTEPRFEFDVTGTVGGYREGKTAEIGDVILLGKPDASFTNSDGNHIILDWKCSGWCSKGTTSPLPGYIALRQENGWNDGAHKNCVPFELGSMTINIGTFLENHNQEWSRQLAIYSWLLGEPIGGDFIVAIDQLACKQLACGIPECRIAQHRLRISEHYQKKTFDRIQDIWEIVHSNHIFRNLTLEDSKAKCQLLDAHAESLYGQNALPDFAEFTRR